VQLPDPLLPEVPEKLPSVFRYMNFCLSQAFLSVRRPSDISRQADRTACFLSVRSLRSALQKIINAVFTHVKKNLVLPGTLFHYCAVEKAVI
ncbi:MAG: hypothetical protein IKN57_01950, partial [Parasporobacterium sp.]|nr:hypothetical protein [Parasporobacterium sp.]